MAKLPSFQFYPGDWMKDPNLRRCSHAAKGVLIDMLCLMFECDRRGYLATAGRPWSDEEIATAVGGDLVATRQTIQELADKGVISRDESGAVYSRRIVRDEQIRRARERAGSLGGTKNKQNRSKSVANHLANRVAKRGSSSSPSGEEGGVAETRPAPRTEIVPEPAVIRKPPPRNRGQGVSG